MSVYFQKFLLFQVMLNYNCMLSNLTRNKISFSQKLQVIITVFLHPWICEGKTSTFTITSRPNIVAEVPKLDVGKFF